MTTPGGSCNLKLQTCVCALFVEPVVREVTRFSKQYFYTIMFYNSGPKIYLFSKVESILSMTFS